MVMAVFWHSFLWSLAAVLAVGVVGSFVDAPAALAQGDDVQLEAGEGVEIQDDPHLYWKCWRTDSPMGAGFTSKDISGDILYGLAFATPYLPGISKDRRDDRGLQLSKVGAEKWKRTRADLIDGRFYRSTGLIGYRKAHDPLGSGFLIPGSDQKVIFDRDPDALLPHWNPFLSDGDPRIRDIDIEWSTGSGRTGQAHADDVDRLQQEQAGSATIDEQGTLRAGAYRGDAVPVAGKLSEYAAVNEDPTLAGQNALGARVQYGTEAAQVVDISGTVTSSGAGGSVSTVVSLESTSRGVTNNVSITDRVDPANPEVFTTTVSQAEDVPRLVIVATTGWLDDSASGHSEAAIKALPGAPVPSGFQYAKPAPSNMEPWGSSCFYVMHEPNAKWGAPFNHREYRLLCWMVRSTSVESPLSPQPVQTLELPVAKLGGGLDMSQSLLDILFPPADSAVARIRSGGTVNVPDVPVWIQSDLTETSDALYYEAASRRRGALAPPEVGDSPDDEIIVSINLKDEYRRDPATRYTFTDDSGAVSANWRLFGDETVGRRVVVDSDVDGDTIYNAGYQQSYMLPPFWGGESDRVIPWMYDHEHSLMGDYGMESLVLWPVYLQDMNYYLFKVDGFTKEHAGDRGHILNLAYAGYSNISRDLNILDGVPGLVLNLFDTYIGKTGEAVAVPVDAKGTSGRKNLGLASLHVNPFTDGKLYYPFYDAETYGSASYWSAYNDDGDTLFDSSDLLKAGVVSPDDGGDVESQYGTNARFQWVIREGEPVLGLEDGNAETVYRRLGFDPRYMARLGRDPFGGQDPAWPNSYISPDETHVMVLTFYEGRLGNRWKFVPAAVADVEFGDAFYEGANRAADAATEATTGALKGALNMVGVQNFDQILSNVNVVPDYGAVPTFQYRRVICRVVIPPEGVVTPATGWTAVTDAVQKAKDIVVDKFLGAIGKLISWLESVPGKVMTGIAYVAAESICHGGGLIAAVGGGENDIGTGKDVDTRADLVISGTEHRDRMAQDKCEDAREHGLNDAPSGDCTLVGAAVDDPACRSVPAIDFMPGVAGLKYGIGWDGVAGNQYRDIWYYAYPGTDEPSADEAYRERISLEASVDADKGVPDLTFRLPYASALGGGLSGSVLNKNTNPFTRDLNVADLLNVVSGADFDGYVLYVRPDSRVFRYVDCTRWKSAHADNECDPPGYPVKSNVAVDPQPLHQQELHRFVLPRYYLRYADADKVFLGAVEEFRFGSVPLQRLSSTDPFCNLKSVAITQGISKYPCLAPSPGLDPLDSERLYDFRNDTIQFVGQSDWEKLSFFLDYVWYLGSDAEYEFAISAYRGVPDGGGDWQEGQLSNWVRVRGGAGVACLAPETYWVSMWNTGDYDGSNPDGVDAFSDYDLAVTRSESFGCAVHLAPSGELSSYGKGSDFYKFQRAAYYDAGETADTQFCASNPGHWRCPGGGPRLRPPGDSPRGVIAGQGVPDLSGVYNSGYLVGSTVCGGIWAGTPSGMTWDSPVVRTVWSIAWVLAMVLLFVLLIWDGLSLTYAGWMSDGRGGVTIGSMAPRFAVALLLASASLFICRLALTLSGDVVCFFVQATGMTFWNFLGGFVFGVFLAVAKVMTPMLAAGGGAFLAGGGLAATGVGLPVAAVMVKLGIIFFLGYLFVLLTALLFVLYYALKVFGTMIVRIVLLMLLIGLAPVAFAMYASPATEHWTKRWVSLFLGTTFQQLVVLIVLFIGASLASTAIWDLNLFTQYWQELFHALAALMVLFLAARIPDLVNPGARGLFSGFGQALAMAGAAAAMVVGGLAGAAGGALGGGQGMSMARGALSRLQGLGSRFGGGGGGTTGGAQGAAAGAMQQSARQGGGALWQQASDMGVGPMPVSEAGARREQSGLGGDAGAMPGAGAGPGGDSGSGGGRPGFFGRLGRGFMAGASRGGQLGRAMHDLQSGRFFLGDPTTNYAGNSQAQVQPFRNYVGGVPFGEGSGDQEASDRVARRRGFIPRSGGGGGGRGYDPNRGRRGGRDDDGDPSGDFWDGDPDGNDGGGGDD